MGSTDFVSFSYSCSSFFQSIASILFDFQWDYVTIFLGQFLFGIFSLIPIPMDFKFLEDCFLESIKFSSQHISFTAAHGIMPEEQRSELG